MSKQKKNIGHFAISWPRRQWLKLVAVVQDHPAVTAGSLVAGVVAVMFYLFVLGGGAHVRYAVKVWRLRAFGGVQELDRASRIFDNLEIFDSPDYNRLDIVSLSLYVASTTFRQELIELVEDDHGRIRIVTLDPRIADPGHPQRAAFENLAGRFGQKPWEFEVECWHSIIKLLTLRDDLGEGIEIRLIAEPSPTAPPGYFLLGRSYHAYNSKTPRKRFDIIVPRPAGEEFRAADSPAHPALRLKNRTDNPEVRRFTKEFDLLWQRAQPIDDALAETLLKRFRGAVGAAAPDDETGGDGGRN